MRTTFKKPASGNQKQNYRCFLEFCWLALLAKCSHFTTCSQIFYHSDCTDLGHYFSFDPNPVSSLCHHILFPLGRPFPCDFGWHHNASSLPDSCYFASDEVANATQAEGICNTKGAHLASINSEEEMQFLLTITAGENNVS